MKNRDLSKTYGYLGPESKEEQDYWKRFMNFFDDTSKGEKIEGSYSILQDYADVFNVYTASNPQPNPFSNKAMFIMDTLTKMGVKYTVDIFTYEGANVYWGASNNSSHKLVNIIAEPNPQATGPATLFIAHHDVANVRSENCQDNGASVCNLLRLSSLIHQDSSNSQKTIILFSDCEESGAKGARRFASKIKKNKENPKVIEHSMFGEISSIINLELTGKGTEVWSDCKYTKGEIELHEKLESVLEKSISKFNTPPSDAIPFRNLGYPVLCIGILPKDELENKNTWRICHSMNDTISGCDRKNMEDFTNFLFKLTKIDILELKTESIEQGDNTNRGEQ